MEHQCLDNTHGFSEIACKYDFAATVWSTNVSTLHKVGAMTWWLTSWSPDPEVRGSSPTRVAVLCP